MGQYQDRLDTMASADRRKIRAVMLFDKEWAEAKTRMLEMQWPSPNLRHSCASVLEGGMQLDSTLGRQREPVLGISPILEI
jgi:hypothetical protein